MHVYLAGPIAGCTNGEAKDWREYVTSQLTNYNVIGVSPLRCEPIVGERYGVVYSDPQFGTARAISSKNKLDVQKCDLTLVYLPREINERRPSYGTVIELAWAAWAGKPVILVTDDPNLRHHPLVSFCASWVLETLDEAIEVIGGVLEVYARG